MSTAPGTPHDAEIAIRLHLALARLERRNTEQEIEAERSRIERQQARVSKRSTSREARPVWPSRQLNMRAICAR
jgi:hypothetical protein